MKKKRRSCPRCKPHKMSISNRWKAREFEQLKRDESEVRSYMKGGLYA